MVELAGPAGVGKSTLLKSLTERGIGQGTIWGLPAFALLGNGIQLLPSLLRLWGHSGSLLWDESRHMVRLRTLHQALRRGGGPGSRAVVFDEGPVFALAWLRGFGHESMRSEAMEAWWQATLSQWTEAVDAVVVLDASDGLLAQRIKARPDWHEIKQSSQPEISIWMARFRAALNWVLAQMAAQGGPVIVRVTTDDASPDRLAEQVLATIQRVSNDN